jgi:hypothetical protein
MGITCQDTVMLVFSQKMLVLTFLLDVIHGSLAKLAHLLFW